MTYVVGLTGGIGSGKSAVARLLEEQGVEVIDTDAIAHELTRPGGAAIEAIRVEFGLSFLDEEGALDRARMRALVFSDPGARRRLESVLHPRIRSLAAERAREAKSPYVVLMVPLLVESGMGKEGGQRYRRVLVIDCPEPLQVERVMARSGLAVEEVRRIVASQASRSARLAAADDVIENDGTLEDLRPKVEKLHAHYLALSAAHRARGG